MTPLQGSLLEVLTEFNRICCANDIKYSLHGGTLLGAVREQGFIPWDDDIDVTMMRGEFEKLIRNTNNYQISVPIIRERSIYRFRKDRNAWLDIFIYDYISQRRVVQALKLLLLDILMSMLKGNEDIHFSTKEKHGLARLLLLRIGFILGKMLPHSTKRAWADSISQSLGGNDTYIHRSNDSRVGRSIVIPADWMDTYTRLSFEGRKFMVTSHYHDVLASCYGENYMTPVRDRNIEIAHANERRLLQKKH